MLLTKSELFFNKLYDKIEIRGSLMDKEKIADLIEFPYSYTVIDIETTGLSAYHNEIIELSALRVRNHEIVSEFSSLIKPGGKINYFISNLTGITNQMLENAPDITKILPEYINFISDDIVLGHNVNFDIEFINKNLKKYFNNGFSNNYIDTMMLSRKHCNLKSNKLQSLAHHYKVDLTGHHRALNDCKITNKIYLKIKEEFYNPPEQKILNLL